MEFSHQARRRSRSYRSRARKNVSLLGGFTLGSPFRKGVSKMSYVYSTGGAGGGSNWDSMNITYYPPMTGTWTTTNVTTTVPWNWNIPSPPAVTAAPVYPTGWECPRCQKIWSPQIITCECEPNAGVASITS